MTATLTHTDALAALFVNPHARMYTTLPVARSCEVCGLDMPVGTAALVYLQAYGDPAVLEVSHRSCDAVVDDAGWDWWERRVTLTDHLCYDVCDLGDLSDVSDLPAEPALLDVVPDDLHDEWRAVWSALRGGAHD